MKMKHGAYKQTSIRVDNAYVAETIEQKVNRILNNKEPITDGAPRIYTERKDGVQPQYDIRTDRFEIAVEAMDVVNKTHKAKREERHKPKDVGEQAKEGMNKEKSMGEQAKDGQKAEGGA